MSKIFRLVLLLCALAMVGVLPGGAARAVITGKVGVGTWGNTAAEFANVKVTQGATTLSAWKKLRVVAAASSSPRALVVESSPVLL